MLTCACQGSRRQRFNNPQNNKEKMEKRQTRQPYTSPQSEVYRLPNHFTLLAGSGEGSFNDYETVNEGETGGWTD